MTSKTSDRGFEVILLRLMGIFFLCYTLIHFLPTFLHSLLRASEGEGATFATRIWHLSQLFAGGLLIPFLLVYGADTIVEWLPDTSLPTIQQTGHLNPPELVDAGLMVVAVWSLLIGSVGIFTVLFMNVAYNSGIHTSVTYDLVKATVQTILSMGLLFGHRLVTDWVFKCPRPREIEWSELMKEKWLLPAVIITAGIVVVMAIAWLNAYYRGAIP